MVRQWRSASRCDDPCIVAFPVSDRSRSSRLAALTLAALGVVFGDIGTSPLYALRECFAGIHAIPVNPGNVLGVLSLIFWSLIITVTLKYLLFVMRADNNGEGGILALVALVRRSGSRSPNTARRDQHRALRRRAVLRRRDDHAGNFGAERRRGAWRRDSRVRARDRAGDRRDPRCALLRAAPRHEPDRQYFWSRHDRCGSS